MKTNKQSIIDLLRKYLGSNKIARFIIAFLDNSMVVSNPKFSVGNNVKLKGSDTYPGFIVVTRAYSPEQNAWVYVGTSTKSVEEALEYE